MSPSSLTGVAQISEFFDATSQEWSAAIQELGDLYGGRQTQPAIAPPPNPSSPPAQSTKKRRGDRALQSGVVSLLQARATARVISLALDYPTARAEPAAVGSGEWGCDADYPNSELCLVELNTTMTGRRSQTRDRSN